MNLLSAALTVSALAPVAEAEVVWATKTTSLLCPELLTPLLLAQGGLPLVGFALPQLTAGSLIS
jgi:hypothetical protein